METSRTIASFQNIGKTIENQIIKSKKSIYISVAWFTNKELIGLLTDKVKNGLDIQVIVSDDIINKRQNPKDFINTGGKFNILPTISSKFLHNKFAIFDNEVVISGSYNWTYFAEYKNHESIIITDSQTIVKQFNIEFKKLLNHVTEYSNTSLVNVLNISADIAEQEFEELEKNLESEFLKTLEEAKKLNVKINFQFIFTFIKSYGAIGASKRLMLTGADNVQSGFIKLCELNRLDLTFESIIIKEKYKLLFDEQTITTAMKRLSVTKHK